MPGSEIPPDAAAEAAFATYLAALQEGSPPDLDAFCAERPAIAIRLRRLHYLWSRQGTATAVESSPGDPARPISQVLREYFGKTQPPDLDLDQPAERGPDSSLKERLQRLAERIALTTRYSLREEMARGGMGVILRVWDEDLRRTLAMKSMRGMLTPKDSSPENAQMVSRFLEEAQITGQLDHPGVVPVHELGIDSKGHVFFTMRMVRGVELGEVIRMARAGEEGWNNVRTLTVILKVCEAMAYAHSKGVIHRDLKPANIMVGKFGESYVMDWGLAKVVGRADSHDLRVDPGQSALMSRVLTDRIEAVRDLPDSPLLTMDGTIVGTPAYMPPEQAEGRVADLDFRADIYSTGALLYTLLTGRMPYVDPDHPVNAGTVLTRLLAGPPPAVSTIDRNVPPELVAICEKAMARRPEGRYPTMEAMAEDLRAYLERRVVRAYQTGAFAEFRKWMLRNRGTAAALAGLVLFAIGASTLVAWRERQRVVDIKEAHALTVKARDDATRSAEEARANESEARRSAKETERKSYLANLAAADASLRVQETSEAQLRLSACVEALRGWEWRHLRLRADTSIATLAGHEGRVSAVALSMDGSLVASGSEDRTVRIWDRATGEQRLLLPAAMEGAEAGGVSAVAFRPDGTRIAAACRDKLVRLWDARHGGLSGVASGHETAVSCLAWKPDGSLFATGSSDETVRFWNGASAQAIGAPFAAEGAVVALAWRPDGLQLAVALEDALLLVDAESREELHRWEMDTAVASLAFSPDGKLLATGALDAAVRLFDTETGKVRRTLTGHVDPVYALVFDDSPGQSGRRLLSASFDQTVRLWDLRDGQSIQVYQGHDGGVLSLAADFARGQFASASADWTVRLWDLERSSASFIIRGDDDLFSSLAVHPREGRLAATAAGSASVRTWDATTGETGDVTGGEAGGLASAAYSSDGTLLAGAGEEDWKIRVWGGEAPVVLSGHEGPVTSVAFCSGNERLVSGCADGTARIWEIGGGTTLFTLEGHTSRVTSVAAAPDGKVIATASADGTVRLWNALTGETLAVRRGHVGAVRAVAFNGSGTLLASGGDDERILLWNMEQEEPVRGFIGHTGPVQTLAFSPDGARLASGGQDKSVRLWNPATGEMLLRIAAHDGWVTGLVFAPDASWIASASFDGTIKIWRTALPAGLR